MTKVTIVKNYRNNVTLRQIDLSEAVQIIQEQAYEELCQQLRHVYPLVEVRRASYGPTTDWCCWR